MTSGPLSPGKVIPGKELDQDTRVSPLTTMSWFWPGAVSPVLVLGGRGGRWGLRGGLEGVFGRCEAFRARWDGGTERDRCDIPHVGDRKSFHSEENLVQPVLGPNCPQVLLELGSVPTVLGVGFSLFG